MYKILIQIHYLPTQTYSDISISITRQQEKPRQKTRQETEPPEKERKAKQRDTRRATRRQEEQKRKISISPTAEKSKQATKNRAEIF